MSAEWNIKPQPFDIVLFNLNSTSSNIIKYSQLLQIRRKYKPPSSFRCKYSHVGMVITTDWLDIKNGEEGKLYIWESTCSKHFKGITDKEPFDVESGHGLIGLQIRPLEQVLDNYKSKGSFGLLRLKPNILKILNSERLLTMKRLKEIHTDNYHQRYESPINLLAAVFPSLRRYRSKNARLFCSEFVGIVLERLNLLKPSQKPENMTPSDFAYPEYSEEKLDVYEGVIDLVYKGCVINVELKDVDSIVVNIVDGIEFGFEKVNDIIPKSVEDKIESALEKSTDVVDKVLDGTFDMIDKS